ncbi:hypothetical protein [Streptococcus sp. E24BD]|uniref:hypothetical protein n=1 Tax=Streptococcus sp. E24BD TaxID=3278715 RepID=UPI00359D158D
MLRKLVDLESRTSHAWSYVRDYVEVILKSGVVITGIIYRYSSKEENGTDDRIHIFTASDDNPWGCNLCIGVMNIDKIKVLHYRFLGRSETPESCLKRLFLENISKSPKLVNL